MNIAKVEADSDTETQESYSESQFIDVHQKFQSVPVSFTENKVS